MMMITRREVASTVMVLIVLLGVIAIGAGWCEGPPISPLPTPTVESPLHTPPVGEVSR